MSLIKGSIAILLLAGVATVEAIDAGRPLTVQDQTRLADLEAKGLRAYTNKDLADYLDLRGRTWTVRGEAVNFAAEVGRFALKGKGQQFRLGASQFDWAEADCVVFVERCLAAALSDNWSSFRLNLLRLRHRGGVVEYRERNMSTLGDWLPNNAWLLEDVTEKLAESTAATFTFAVRPAVFETFPAGPGSKYTRTVYKGSDYRVAPEIHTSSYVPKEQVRSIVSGLRTGDVVLILVKSSGGHLGCNHMGIVYVSQNETSMIAGGPPVVRPVPLTGMAGYADVAGFKFLRLRADACQLAATERAKVITSPASPEQEDSKIAACRSAGAK